MKQYTNHSNISYVIVEAISACRNKYYLLNNKVLEYKMVNKISKCMGSIVTSNTSNKINVYIIDIEISCKIIYVNHIYIFYKKRQSRMKQIF